MHIYLASKSPRRQSLLNQIAISFDCIDVDIDESVGIDELPYDYACRMAKEKAQAGWDNSERSLNYPLLAADTCVVLANQIMGKPNSQQEARNMLNQLSGNVHQVITSVTVRDQHQHKTVSSVTEVTFAPLNTEQIEYYIGTGDCMDKAGSYGIQGFAARFIKHISGSYTGVVGLPLFETANLLEEFRH